MTITAALLALLITAAPAAPALASTRTDASSSQQGSGSPPPGIPRADPDQLPIDLEKIQRALAKEPAIRVDEPIVRSTTDLPRFRVHIEREAPSIQEILGPDFLRGPVAYGGLTHQEFLNMVTPKDVQGYAAFSNGQAITVALTSLAAQWAVNTAIRKLQDARDERAREAARKEVQEALEALRKARRDAGLPDR